MHTPPGRLCISACASAAGDCALSAAAFVRCAHGANLNFNLGAAAPQLIQPRLHRRGINVASIAKVIVAEKRSRLRGLLEKPLLEVRAGAEALGGRRPACAGLGRTRSRVRRRVQRWEPCPSPSGPIRGPLRGHGRSPTTFAALALSPVPACLAKRQRVGRKDLPSVCLDLIQVNLRGNNADGGLGESVA
jgi:hypothetical protein